MGVSFFFVTGAHIPLPLPKQYNGCCGEISKDRTGYARYADTLNRSAFWNIYVHVCVCTWNKMHVMKIGSSCISLYSIYVFWISFTWYLRGIAFRVRLYHKYFTLYLVFYERKRGWGEHTSACIFVCKHDRIRIRVAGLRARYQFSGRRISLSRRRSVTSIDVAGQDDRSSITSRLPSRRFWLRPRDE